MYRSSVAARSIADFIALDLRVGTIVRAEPNVGAKHPAIALWIDLGDDNPVQSSAKIADLYQPDALVGTQVVVVTGFEPLRVGGFRSDVLVLGALTDKGVVLLRPESEVAPGSSVS